MQKKQTFSLKGKVSSVSEGGQLILSFWRWEREKRHQFQSLRQKMAGFSDSGQNISSPWHGLSTLLGIGCIMVYSQHNSLTISHVIFVTAPLQCTRKFEHIHRGQEILLTRALLTYLAKSHKGQRPCLSLFCWEFALRQGRLKWVGKLLAILPPSLEKH